MLFFKWVAALVALAATVPKHAAAQSPTASPSLAPVGLAVTNTIANTYSYSGSNYAFSGTFTQTFISAGKGYPRYLNVYMGNNQNPFDVTVTLSVRGVSIVSKRFTGLVQIYNEWTVPFDFGVLGNYINLGDTVSFTLSSPSTSVGFSSITSQITNFTQGTLSGYGNVNSRFYLRTVDYVSQSPSASASATPSLSVSASASPTISTTASPSLAPVGLPVTNTIANTYSYSGSNYALSGTFTQTFISAGAGYPRYLNIWMGNNQNPFDITVSLSVRGVTIFTKRFTGLVQIYNEWTVPFDFGVLGNYIRVGDTVSFTLSSPSTSIGFSSITSQITNFTQGFISGYGNVNARFYLRTVDYVSQSPSVSPSVTPSTSLSASPSASISVSPSTTPSMSTTASPSLAPVGLPVTNTIANTYSYSGSNYALSGTFTQTFISAGAGYPRYLNIWMGNNQNPFDITVSLSIRGVTVITKRFTGLVQIMNEWTVPFDFGVLGNYINVGDTVSFTLSSPSTSIGFSSITSQITNFTQGFISGYGNVNARFYLRTVDYVSQSPSITPSVTPSTSLSASPSASVSSSPSTTPSTSTTASPSLAPVGLPVTNTIANTYSYSGSNYALSGTFTQTFISAGAGYPRYLNIWMGNNQNPFDITVSLSINGVTVITKRFTGLVQIYNEWTVPFDFGVLGNYIKVGDTVSFTLSSPSTSIGFSSITSQITNFTQGYITGYGNVNARFYLRTVDYVSQSPSSTPSTSLSASPSTSVSAAPSTTPSASATASPSLAPVGLPVTNTIANTYSYGGSNYALSGTFTQTFISAGAGYPRYLNIWMGNNQNPFDITVSLSINGVTVITKRFTGLVQIYDEWTVPFDFGVLGNYINVGDTVSFTLSSPSTSIGFSSITSQIPNFTQGYINGYGNVNARFYLRTVDYVSQSPSSTPSTSLSASPSASVSAVPSPTPSTSATASPGLAPVGLPVINTIANTYSYDGSDYELSETFTQTFISAGVGYPKYLNIWMGNNQNPFDITVSLSINGVTVFTNRFTGLVQIYDEWTVPFDFGELGNYINVGDTVSFTLSSPSTSIGFSSITSEIPNFTQGYIDGYGNVNARFYLRTIDYVSA